MTCNPQRSLRRHAWFANGASLPLCAIAPMPPAAAAKSDFLRKFENRISVVGRDGTVTKVGDDPKSNPSPHPVDSSSEDMGGITRMHPALADALLGNAEPPRHFAAPAFPSPARSPARIHRPQAAPHDSLGSFAPPVQQTIIEPPPVSGQRVVKNKPSVAELKALAQEEGQRFGRARGGSGGGPTFKIDDSGNLHPAAASSSHQHMDDGGGAGIQMHANHAALLGLGAPEPFPAASPAASPKTRSPAGRQRQWVTSAPNHQPQPPPPQPSAAAPSRPPVAHPPVSRMAYGASQLGQQQSHANRTASQPTLTNPSDTAHAGHQGANQGAIWPPPPPGFAPPPLGMPPMPHPACGWAPPPFGFGGGGMPGMPGMPPPPGMPPHMMMPHGAAPPQGHMPPYCYGYPGGAPGGYPGMPMPPAPPSSYMHAPAAPPEPPPPPAQQPRASRRAAAPPAAPNVQHVRHSSVSGSDELVAGGRRAQRSAPSSNDKRHGGGAGGNSRRSHDATRVAPNARDRAAVYQSVPHTADIHAADKPGGGGHDGGNGRQSVGYKPYTGKVSKEYETLGYLKPDLNDDELLKKRANADRIKMFSRNLRVINREEEAQIHASRREREAGGAPASNSPIAPTKEVSKREKAKEYARRVPKPRARANEEAAAVEQLTEVGDDELDALAMLEKQHQEHKAAAARIRDELGL